MATKIPVITIKAGASAHDIQVAIDTAPAGAIIKLSAGNYTFTETVVIDRDDITIEGAGVGETVITLSKSAKDMPAFQIGAPEFGETMSDGGTIAAASDGATTVTMTGGDAPRVGDVVFISAENDQALFDSIGDTTWQKDKPLRTMMAVVTDVSGGTITLDRDLPMDFPKGTTIQVLETADNVTISGMTFVGGYGAADPGDFTNTIAAGNDAGMIVANGTTGLTILDVSIENPVSSGVIIGKSLDPVVDDLSVHGSHNKGDGGNGYGLEIRDVYDGKFTDLTMVDTRHAVVFASFASSNGNTVEVTYTNRDINFHGGLDTDNTVTVLESIRDTKAEQGYMAAVTFANEGTSYGAPTDMSTNHVSFGKVIGTVRSERVQAVDTGADIQTLGGSDTLIGGHGNDKLDGGTGTDTFYASAGQDTLIGGSGADMLIVDGNKADYSLIKTSSGLSLISADGTTAMSGIETIKFNDGTVAAGSVTETVAKPIVPVIAGTAQYDIHTSSASVIAGKDFNAINFTGSSDASFVGNDLSNRAKGNAGDNLMHMGGGDDVAIGGAGNDSLFGGAGNDLLTGGAGNDILRGDDGIDRLRGDAGADLFVASGGTNFVVGFSHKSGDSFAFEGHSEAEVLDAIAQWSDDPSADLDGFTMTMTTYNGHSSLSVTTDEGENLVFVNYGAEKLLGVYDWM
ncbi:MAG: hypothetical protein ABI459_00860 [Deltaproteobacteria bacterium]